MRSLAFGNTQLSGGILSAEREIPVPPAIGRFLSALALHLNAHVETRRLYAILYSGKLDGGPDPGIMTSWAYQARKALRSVGSDAKLVSRHSLGYKLVATPRDPEYAVRMTEKQYAALNKLVEYADQRLPTLASLVSSAVSDAVVVDAG